MFLGGDRDARGSPPSSNDLVGDDPATLDAHGPGVRVGGSRRGAAPPKSRRVKSVVEWSGQVSRVASLRDASANNKNNMPHNSQ